MRHFIIAGCLRNYMVQHYGLATESARPVTRAMCVGSTNSCFLKTKVTSAESCLHNINRIECRLHFLPPAFWCQCRLFCDLRSQPLWSQCPFLTPIPFLAMFIDFKYVVTNCLKWRNLFIIIRKKKVFMCTDYYARSICLATADSCLVITQSWLRNI